MKSEYRLLSGTVRGERGKSLWTLFPFVIFLVYTIRVNFKFFQYLIEVQTFRLMQIQTADYNTLTAKATQKFLKAKKWDIFLKPIKHALQFSNAKLKAETHK